MNKRGDTTVWHEIIKAIPAIMIVLILLAAGVKIYNSLHPEQYSVEKKDLKRIVAEIKDLKNNGEVSIPVFSSDNYDVQIFKVDEAKRSVYSGCNLNYCACFKKNSYTICETFNIDKNEFNLDNDKTIVEFLGSASTKSSIKLIRSGNKAPAITLSNI